MIKQTIVNRYAITMLLVLSVFIVEAQNNVGIGLTNPQEKLHVAGGIRLGTTTGIGPGTIRFHDGQFEGNVDSTTTGWRPFYGPWIQSNSGDYYLSTAMNGPSAAIGDSLFNTDAKFIVKREVVFGGTGINSRLTTGNTTIAEAQLAYQYSVFPDIRSNFGVLGTVYDDSYFSQESFGVAGNNLEQDNMNYGGYFVAQGGGDHNIGVFGKALNGGHNWAGYFDGATAVMDHLSVGTEEVDSEATVQIKLPASGNFAHVQIESPGNFYGFGLMFKDTVHAFWMGQNIGNWNDGRFVVVSDSSFNTFAMLQNGDIGLTNTTFTTPFARLQVPQKGSLNNGNMLDLNNAAIFIGETQMHGMAFDENQIETVGEDLYLNYNSDKDVHLAEGGGNVAVDAGTPKAKFHVGLDETVLFGKDTIGDGTVGSKLMWLPGQGGAFRAGLLNYDGSVGNATGFWDPDNIGWASVAIGNNTLATGAGSVAIGIRSHAGNFGAVALGHLSRALGNSALALGYYVRADAFVGTAVGSGNTGGGNADYWVDTDPIFEVGNSLDTANRHNALTVLKNARVGINHSNPQAMLDIEQPNSGIGNGVLMNLSGYGHWETSVDVASDYNFYFNNSLKAYIQDTDGAYVQYSDRRLKQDIHPIRDVLSKLLALKPSSYVYKDAPDAEPSIGFIAQDVQPVFPQVVCEKDGYLGINYQGFAALTVKGIQELAAENASLKQEVEELKQLVNELIDKKK